MDTGLISSGPEAVLKHVVIHLLEAGVWNELARRYTGVRPHCLKLVVLLLHYFVLELYSFDLAPLDAKEQVRRKLRGARYEHGCRMQQKLVKDVVSISKHT